jgi:hypothetical protein
MTTQRVLVSSIESVPVLLRPSEFKWGLSEFSMSSPWVPVSSSEFGMSERELFRRASPSPSPPSLSALSFTWLYEYVVKNNQNTYMCLHISNAPEVASVRVCKCLRIICVYIYIYMCIYKYTYIYIYTHIYTHIHSIPIYPQDVRLGARCRPTKLYIYIYIYICFRRLMNPLWICYDSSMNPVCESIMSPWWIQYDSFMNPLWIRWQYFWTRRTNWSREKSVSKGTPRRTNR